MVGRSRRREVGIEIRVGKKPVTDVEKKTEQVWSEELKVDKDPSRRSV